MTAPATDILSGKRRGAISCIVRGCGTMPHVGEHPGTGFVVGMVVLGAASGAKAGLLGALGGAAIMAVVMVPLYLIGAYSRARISDRISIRQHMEKES